MIIRPASHPGGGFVLAAMLCLASGVSVAGAPPRTVPQLDLSRYAGLWYEVAKLPNRFQDQCAGNTTARYTLREDGRIDVRNRCLTEDGGYDAADGIARVVDTQTRAELEVSFVNLLGWQLFWGDYWVLDLGPDYAYAVVGHPERRYGWILSRTPALPPGTRESIDALLRSQGYDPADFVDTPQGLPAPG